MTTGSGGPAEHPGEEEDIFIVEFEPNTSQGKWRLA